MAGHRGLRPDVAQDGCPHTPVPLPPMADHRGLRPDFEQDESLPTRVQPDSWKDFGYQTDSLGVPHRKIRGCHRSNLRRHVPHRRRRRHVRHGQDASATKSDTATATAIKGIMTLFIVPPQLNFVLG